MLNNEYPKAEFRKQVAIGVEYQRKYFTSRWLRLVLRVVQPNLDSVIDNLTDHLYPIIGASVHNATQVDKREFGYNAPERSDDSVIFVETLEEDKIHMGIDEIDEHEGEVNV